MLKRALLAAVVAVAASSTGAMAYHYGYGGHAHYVSPAEAFQHQAARDGRITKDEWRIINALRAQSYQPGSERYHGRYGYQSSHDYNRPYRRWHRYGYDRW